jgi:hypothetical protein
MPAKDLRGDRAGEVGRQPFREVNLPACEIFRKQFKGCTERTPNHV